MTFACRDGCGKCCWAVPFPTESWDLHQDAVQREVLETWQVLGDNILPITADLLCPFLTEQKRCAIYGDRPEVCRRFGTRGNPCPYVRPDGTPRTSRGVRRIEGRWGHSLDEESLVSIRSTVPAKKEGYKIEVTQIVAYVRDGARPSRPPGHRSGRRRPGRDTEE